MTKMTLGRLLAAGAVVAACGSLATAYDYDTTGKAGLFNTTKMGTLVKGAGGSFDAVRVFAPHILDETDGQYNAVAVQNVGGNPVGVVTTFLGGAAAASRSITVLGTIDNTAAPCGFFSPLGSNDVILDENDTSDSLGTFLPDGTIVFRENFAGVQQNNIAFETGIVGIAAQPCAPDNLPTNKVFGNFCGIDALSGVGSVFLGTPGALRNAGVVWTGVTTFNNGTTGSPPCGGLTGTGVWTGTGADPNAPLAFWLASATPLPVTVPTTDADEVRQTQPVIRMINTPAGGTMPYAVFGVGFSAGMVTPTPLSGGSARPVYFAVDEISGGGLFDANTVYIEADKALGMQAGNRPGDAGYDINNTLPTSRFIDHQATGGGAGPFVNSQFDMNNKGEIVTLWEDLNTTPRVTQVRLYRPIWNAANTRIIGYQSPVVIADNVADPFIVDTLQTTGAAPTFTLANLVPFSGVSIADTSAIAYVAVTEKFEAFRDLDMNPATPDNVVLLNTTNGLYYVEPTTGSTHEIVRGGQTGDILLDTSAAGQRDLHVGAFFVDTNSDSFQREGLSDDGQWLAVTFRDGGNENATDQDLDMFADLGGWLKVRGSAAMTGETSVRGTLMINVGAFTATPACPGDVNGDGMVGLADIAGITSCWNQPASCNPGADQDGNGVIGLSDIALVTGNWAAVCP